MTSSRTTRLLTASEAPIYSCCGTDSMNIDHVLFIGTIRSARPPDTSGFQLGGAIFNVDGVVNISASTFVNNQALGFERPGRCDPDQLRFDVEHHGQHLHRTTRPSARNTALEGRSSAIPPSSTSIPASSSITSPRATAPFQTTRAARSSMNATTSTSRASGHRDRHQQRFHRQPGRGSARQRGRLFKAVPSPATRVLLFLSGSTFTGNQAVGGQQHHGLRRYHERRRFIHDRRGHSKRRPTRFSTTRRWAARARWGLVCHRRRDRYVLRQPIRAEPGLDDREQSLLRQPGRRRRRRRVVRAHGRRRDREPGVPDRREQHGLSWKSSNRQPGFQRVAGTEADGGAIWVNGSTMTIQGGLIAATARSAAPGVMRRAVPAVPAAMAEAAELQTSVAARLPSPGTTIAGNSAIGGAGGNGSTRGTGGNGHGRRHRGRRLFRARPSRAAS